MKMIARRDFIKGSGMLAVLGFGMGWGAIPTFAAHDAINPFALKHSLSYTLNAGQSKTTYKYSIPTSATKVYCLYTINTAGGAISAVLYGATSTATANHLVAEGSARYGDIPPDGGMDGVNMSLVTGNPYPMYCTKVTNTSNQTISVTLELCYD